MHLYNFPTSPSLQRSTARKEGSGRRKERDERERIRSLNEVVPGVCGCCVPDSGTAVAPSLFQNHWEIFTDRRGGEKVLHLGVREGEGVREGGVKSRTRGGGRRKERRRGGGGEMLTFSSNTHTIVYLIPSGQEHVPTPHQLAHC